MTDNTGWTCPNCGRTFAKVNQGHVCKVYTVEGHLADKPDAARRLYDRFMQLLHACGPFDYNITKSLIGFRGPRRAFAGVRLTKKGLQGYMDMTRPVENDPRFTNVTPYTKRLFVHTLLITSEDQLDETFAGYVRDAYAVGQGEHLEEA